VARRRTPADPELAALARERLARVLGGPAPERDRLVPRRAARSDQGEWTVGGTPEWAVGGTREGLHRAALDAEGLDGEGRRDRSPVGIEDLEPPRHFTRWHLAVVAVVLLVGLVWGGWSWFRSRPEAVAAVPAVATAQAGQAATVPPSGSTPSPSGGPGGAGSAGGGGPGASPGPSASTEGPVVHVLGAVAHPGLVRLRAGARVQDALRAAGGLRRDAAPDELNLAQPLADGVQVVVGTRRHPEGEVRAAGSTTGGSGSGGPGADGSAGSAAGAGVSVDLNAAGAEQLETLPGVGPVTAQKILDWRQQHGRFSRVDELQEVDGIGPKTYARIAPRARV